MSVVVVHPKIVNYLQKTQNYIKENHPLVCDKYVRLGSKVVKLACHSQEFIPLIKKQLSYVLQDHEENCGATVILWREKDCAAFIKSLVEDHFKTRIRLQRLIFKNDNFDFEIVDQVDEQRQIISKVSFIDGVIKNFEVIDSSYSKHNPVIRVYGVGGIITIYDQRTNTYFYGVNDLNPEEFIKQGHIFVQIFNKIAKTENTALVHGAVVGIDNKGVLMCARGQRGKSTLAVLAMMRGFDYVSDDYLVLEQEGSELYSYPIYSIITLSPRMYNELYDDLKGKFVSNNARRDKYVIDVQNYHDAFRDKYPIKVCLFPQIVDDATPSIVPCKKGRAIAQLVHSTIIQLEDKHDIKTIKKLISFIKDFDFYQINLCADIQANVECLRKFCQQQS